MGWRDVFVASDRPIPIRVDNERRYNHGLPLQLLEIVTNECINTQK